MKIYRFTTNGEGVWSAGKRMLPPELVAEANLARKWLPKPQLPEGDYSFYMTQQGRDMYESTLMNVHEKYLSDILCEEINMEGLGTPVYQDEWQVVFKK